MMTPSRASAEVAGLFAPMLQEAGFVRSGLNFYRSTDESILLVSIQTGTHWLGPYVNLGVYYHKFGETMERPGIVDCHVQTRLTSVVPNPLREGELLQMSNDISLDTRRAELLGMMRNYGLSWLEGMEVFESARTFLQGSTKAAHVAPIAREGLTPPLKDKK